MTRRIAIIGDVHGCLEELKELIGQLRAEGITEIYHLGDLVDRGPDSAAVVKYCREHQILGVMGNHESSLLRFIDRRAKNPDLSAGEDRDSFVDKLSSEDINYLHKLPKLHVIDEMNLVLVHAGLFPGRSLWQQDLSVLFMQVINPTRPGDIRWRNKAGQYTLESSRAEGYSPWQELYDGAEEVVYGHTVFAKPFVKGLTTGIDTGCVFGGSLTALILPERRFSSVKAKRQYSEREFEYDA